jgi:hypothetical protein
MPYSLLPPRLHQDLHLDILLFLLVDLPLARDKIHIIRWDDFRLVEELVTQPEYQEC